MILMHAIFKSSSNHFKLHDAGTGFYNNVLPWNYILLLGTGSHVATDPKDHSVDLLGHSDGHPGCNSHSCEWCNCTFSVRLWRHSRSQNPDLDVNRRSWSTRPQGDLHTRWYRCTNEIIEVTVQSETVLSVCGTVKVLHFGGSVQWVFDGLQRRTHVSLSHVHHTTNWTERVHENMKK